MREHHNKIRVRNFTTRYDHKGKFEYLAINGYGKTIYCYSHSALQDALRIQLIFGNDNIDGLLLDVCARQMRDGLVIHSISVIME